MNVPKAASGTGLQCSACPSYGVLALDCTGWISAADTIVTPSGPKSATKFTSTGCRNQTITLESQGQVVTEYMVYSVDVWYPVGGQDPLRITAHQEIWEDLPPTGQALHFAQDATYDITRFEVGSLSAASFAHCTPSIG